MSSAPPGPSARPAAPVSPAAFPQKTFFFRSLAGLLVLSTVVQLVTNLAVFALEEHVMPDATLFVVARDQGFRLAQRSVPRPESLVEASHGPVVLVDISRLRRVDLYGRIEKTYTPLIDYTPREELTKLLAILQPWAPAAIGIDVDFSPDYEADGGRTPKGQEDLMEFCLAQTAAGKSPIYLGVGRGSGSPDPTHWLGSPDYVPLAASAILLTEETGITPPVYSLIPRAIKFSSLDQPLPSLSSALIRAYQRRHPNEPLPAPPCWLQCWADKSVPFQQPAIRGVERTISAYQINYAQVDALAHHKVDAIALFDAGHETLAAYREQFRGRIVLIGAADFLRAPDKIVMPGKRLLIPGIYAHASGILTQLRSPLWRLKQGASLGLGIGLSFACSALALLASHRWPFLAKGARKELLGLLLSFLFILPIACALARWGNVLWIGSIGTAIGACIEVFVALFFLSHLHPPEKAAAAGPQPATP